MRRFVAVVVFEANGLASRLPGMPTGRTGYSSRPVGIPVRQEVRAFQSLAEKEKMKNNLKESCIFFADPKKIYLGHIPACMRKQSHEPRQYSIVRFTPGMKKWLKKEKKDIDVNTEYVYFGEMPNVPGHAIVCNTKTKEWIFGMHIDELEEVPVDET